MIHRTLLILFVVCLFTTTLKLTAQGAKIKPGTATIVQQGTTMKLITGDLIIQSDSVNDATLIDWAHS